MTRRESPDCGRCGRVLDLAEGSTGGDGGWGVLMEWKTGLICPLQPEYGSGRRERLCESCGHAFRTFLLDFKHAEAQK